MPRTVIRTDKAPAPLGVYSQAVAAGGLLFVSGQIPLDPATGNMINGDFKAKTRRVLQSLKGIVEAAGGRFDEVVKMNVYLTDLSNFTLVNEVFSDFFGSEPPARAAVQVGRLPLDAEVEIECVAQLPEKLI